MTEEVLTAIRTLIRTQFYYVAYPENVDSGWWIDGGGKWHLMTEMGLDHLKACIKKVENDISHLERSGRQTKVVKTIVPLAQGKLDELKDAFRKNALG